MWLGSAWLFLFVCIVGQTVWIATYFDEMGQLNDIIPLLRLFFLIPFPGYFLFGKEIKA